MVTCRSRQVTELPDEKGVGNAVAIEISLGVAVAMGVAVSPVEEQAVSNNNPNKT